nr:MAG TPA: hypothetical protein [Caudoviricetes sp.]
MFDTVVGRLRYLSGPGNFFLRFIFAGSDLI